MRNTETKYVSSLSTWENVDGTFSVGSFYAMDELLKPLHYSKLM